MTSNAAESMNGSFQPSRIGTRMRCADDEIGRNSVSPCTIPRIAAWIKPSNLNQLGMAVYNGIGGTNGYGFGIGNGQAAPGVGSKLTGLVGSTGFDGGYTFVDATSWHLVTMARSGTTITIYVDGKQTATSAITPTSTWSKLAAIGPLACASNVHQAPSEMIIATGNR